MKSGLSAQDLDLGAAELGVVPALDLAAELRRHGLLAVADAEDRHVRRRTGPAARAGDVGAVTDSGPPERITPFGFMLLEGLLRLVERHDLANRPPPPARAGR